MTHPTLILRKELRRVLLLLDSYAAPPEVSGENPYVLPSSLVSSMQSTVEFNRKTDREKQS